MNDLTFDTKPPLNINESDIEPNMPDFPAEREGFTEMTFCLIRVKSMQAAWELFRKSSASSELKGHVGEDVLSREQRDTLLKELEETLQSKYLRHCDLSVPSQLIIFLTPQLIFKRLWLMIHAPRTATNDTSKPSQIPGPYDAKIRDQLFRTSIEILELSSRLLLDPLLTPWHWHSHTYIQWSAVALVLSELCARPPSADCDRAWECVQKAYDVWKLNKRAHKGTLWRPIRRMMAKARYVREMQQAGPKERGQLSSAAQLNTSSTAVQPAILPVAGSNSTPSSTFTAAEDSRLENPAFLKDLGVFGEMFGELFSMDFSEDVFNTEMCGMGQF